MIKQWKYIEVPDRLLATELANNLNVPFSFAKILVQRGVTSFEEAKSFFRPNIDELHDPFLMKDMEPAVERLAKSIDLGEKIMVFGDYDVDGTTSVAMMFGFLEKKTEHLIYHIPDRYNEGYGLSKIGIDRALAENVSLIITLDCGVRAVELIAYGKSKGIDFIVCDHHEAGNELPDGLILDPKRKDCGYPFKELSGCGVGFKLIQAFLIFTNEDPSLAFEYVDLLAISIAADIVPIVGENRILTGLGLEKINTNPSYGVAQLLQEHKNKGQMNVMDVVFGIAPKINAAGRIGSAATAVNLLLSVDKSKSSSLVKQINTENSERKDLDKRITEEALLQVKSKKDIDKKASLVYNENWHKGVIGIVASRLIETYYRPTIVLTKSGENWAGSARSVRGFSVYEAIDACSEHLIQFGGHKYAAGLTIEEGNIEAFKLAFEKYVAKTITDEQLTPSVLIDAELDFIDLKSDARDQFPKFYRLTKQLAPFGPGNMRPVFVSREVMAHSVKIVGEKHLKLSLGQENCSVKMSAIGFNLAEYEAEIVNQPFHIVYNIEENYWNGNTTLQLNIKDIKLGQIDL
jgi:single-stranded-DNA-specific exonuclease